MGMFDFKPGDIVVSTTNSPWRKLQLFEDHIFIIESCWGDKLTRDYGHCLRDYSKPTINKDPIPNPFRLCDEHTVDKILNKYGSN